ncbi:MAG: ADP-ribosylglycohydrolase family protein [Oscillospiraceae bacterium]|nr:ADP-ribosylglycohydrolase family protein [Oscillospiraceae bacterium]
MDKIRNGALKGAIVGDIVGSIYEFNNHRSKVFPLFGKKCSFTDDSVMSVAVAHAIALWKGWTGDDGHRKDTLFDTLVDTMQAFGNYYPFAGYGGRFGDWLCFKDPKPYNSWGNGAPMRCSAAGMLGDSAEEAYKLGEATAEVTHNHPYAMKAAGLTAELIWRARHGASMEELRKRAEEEYDIESCAWFAENNEFTEASQYTMPPALAAFLESTSFEDCIRNSVYVGGDTDTIGAIAGAMAEAYWGIPDDIWAKAESYLDERLLEVVDRFYKKFV